MCQSREVRQLFLAPPSCLFLRRSSVLPSETAVTTVSSLGKTSVSPKGRTRTVNKQPSLFLPRHERRCYTKCVILDVTSIELTEMLLYRAFHLKHDNSSFYWNLVIQSVPIYTWYLLSLLRCCYTGHLTLNMTILRSTEIWLYRVFQFIRDIYWAY